MNHRHHTGTPNLGVYFIGTAHLQCTYHTVGGVNFFKTQFWVGMQIPAQRGQFGMKSSNVGKRPAMSPDTGPIGGE
jgi:hypothetical protein